MKGIEKKPDETPSQSLIYDEPVQEIYIKKENPVIDLNKIVLQNSKDKKEVLYGGEMTVCECNSEIHAVRFFSTVESHSQNTEKLMLLSVDYEIYAYRLIPIAFLRDKTTDRESIEIIMRKPQFNLNFLSRKRLSNEARAYEVDLVQEIAMNQKTTYRPYPVDISCGKVIIENKGRRIDNQNVSNHIDKFTNTYSIDIIDDLYKSQIFEKIKWLLSGEFFLPDWINLFEFINLSDAKTYKNTRLDCNATMVVLSTIDTVDLHSFIRKNKNNNETITISKNEYESMKKDIQRLKRLERLEVFS